MKIIDFLSMEHFDFFSNPGVDSLKLWLVIIPGMQYIFYSLFWQLPLSMLAANFVLC